MNKLKFIALLLVVFCVAAFLIYNRPSQKLGFATLATSDNQNTERSLVNFLYNHDTNFGTSTANTFTAANTFSAGWVISATSTGTKGIALTGGCFSLNGTCLPTTVGSSTLLTDSNTWSSLQTFATAIINVLTLTSASTTNQTVSNFFQLPSGATQAPTAAGALALDTTDNQLKIGDGSATQVITQYRYIVYPFSTTTTWGGTTTPVAFVLPVGMTFDKASCNVTPYSATLNVQIQHGQTPTKLINFVASSTVGNVEVFSSNNTPSAGATTTAAFGSPTGSPTDVSCTVTARVTGT